MWLALPDEVANQLGALTIDELLERYAPRGQAH